MVVVAGGTVEEVVVDAVAVATTAKIVTKEVKVINAVFGVI